jgi:mRNA interferase RelE/StbE
MDSARPRVYVRLTDPAVADFERLVAVDPQIVRWALKKMLLLERDPEAGRPLLGDLIGWRKLVVGDRDWRIVWRVTTGEAGNQVIDIAEVCAVGARADAEVYAETSDRISALGRHPTAQALSDVIERLERAAGSVTAATEPVPDPVPRQFCALWRARSS